MRIIFSEDPDSENARGVAIVLNKDITNINNMTATEIVPGRALLLETVWHGTERLSILGVYAPNDAAENGLFWAKIREYFETHHDTPAPDIVLGDMNVVEEPIDRLPMHADSEAATDELDNLKTALNLIDGWRNAFPTTRSFTFLQTATGSESRIDRIYTHHDITEQCMDWEIKTTGIPTDHRMVSVRISIHNSPNLGRGRWSWPKHLIKDKQLSAYMKEKGIQLQDTLESLSKNPDLRTPQYNPQTIWADFKKDIAGKAR